jgi:phospholipase/lecithinase/hemolysin
MTFSGILRSAAAALCIGLAVAACGGGDTVEPFEPTGMAAFGDELSFIGAGGARYTVNPLNDDGSLRCDANPLWIQVVARQYGMKFETDPCLETDETPKGKIFAAPGAKVADIAGQIDTFLAGVTPGAVQLAMLWAGMNDVVELYGQYPAQTEAALLIEANARGKALAEQANRIGRSGNPVVVVTIPDMGLTPLARAGGDEARRVMSALSREFNGGIHVNLLQDGRLVGIVFGEAETQNATEVPSSYGYKNVVEAVCLASAPLPTCTTDTLVVQDNPATEEDEGVTAGATYLWADATHPAPTFHTRIGSLTLTRARNNPF